MSNPKQQQIIAQCKVIFEKAKALYGIDLSGVGIRFDLKGKSAGSACGVRNGDKRSYYIRFNDNLIQNEFEHILHETVPHEIAHIVCFINPSLGNRHDYGWASVCKKLGGTGGRTHDMAIIYGTGNTYEYITTNGSKVRLSHIRHKQVHSGETFSFRNNLGKVHKECEYSIVGCNGKAFTTALTKESDQYTKVKLTTAPISAVLRLGVSKANISRKIMLDGYKAGTTYEDILAEMMAVNGYTRQLARATYTANAPKVGIPL